MGHDIQLLGVRNCTAPLGYPVCNEANKQANEGLIPSKLATVTSRYYLTLAPPSTLVGEGRRAKRVEAAKLQHAA